MYFKKKYIFFHVYILKYSLLMISNQITGWKQKSIIMSIKNLKNNTNGIA